MRVRRTAVGLVILVLAATLAAGCGGSSNKSATTGNTGAAATSNGSAAGSKSVKNVTLNLYDGASGAFTNTFNPFISTGNTTATWGLIYEPLFFYNLMKANAVTPMLGTEKTWNADGTELDVTTREGVTWTDGKPFSAKDVAFTINLISKNAALNGSGVPFKSAEATDDTHVKILFTEPAFTHEYDVLGTTWIVPEHIFSSISDPAKDPNTKPVGTGPYLLDKFTPQGYSLKKNPNYWQAGKPEVAEVHYLEFSGNDQAINALVAGKVDWMGGFINDIDKTYASKAPTNKYVNAASMVTTIECNLKKADNPAADPAVRQAMYYAIDRDKINTTAFSGYSTPASPTFMQIPRDEGFISAKNKDLKPSFDAAKSAQILQADGWTKGSDGIYEKNGKKLKLSLILPAGWSDWVAAAQAMQQQMKAVGIDLEPNQVQYADWMSQQKNFTYDVAMQNLWGGPTPYFRYNTFYATGSLAPAGNNTSGYSNKAVDDALAQIASTTDAAKQQQAYDTIQDQLVKDMPYIPIMQSSSLAEYSTAKVSGWPTEEDMYATPTTFSKPDNGVILTHLTVN